MKKSDITVNGRINDPSQVAGIKRYVLSDGAAAGLKVVECDNGKLRFLLNESKALDIMQIFYQGKNLSFVSKNGFIARETDFINRFEGGALYTCGLDAVGAVEGKGIHGRFHNIPAKVTRADMEEDGLTVEAEIRFTSLFGENITVKRKIFTAYDIGKIELSDKIINYGGRDEKFCLLYHVNLGYPLLFEGGKIFADTEDVRPRNDWARENLSAWDTVYPPEDSVEEVCYYLEPKDKTVCYFHPKTGRKFTLNYSGEMKKVIIWKSWQAGDYSLGIEPTTTFLDGEFCYSELPKRSEKEFGLTLTIE
ncbi:MAG: DUF4432 family protein [Clostridia bacterium]|nr:DUF4432 family protein [Clostridia bacterium]